LILLGCELIAFISQHLSSLAQSFAVAFYRFDEGASLDGAPLFDYAANPEIQPTDC